jgi:hypothetical protein
MARERNDRAVEAFGAMAQAAEQMLARAVRAALAAHAAEVRAEIRDLRKAVARLQRALQGAPAVAAARGRSRGSVKVCGVDGCGSKHAAKGLCKNHYQQWLNRKKKEGPNAPKPGSPRRRPR